MMARSYTNAFFAPSFEASVKTAFPSIVRLRVLSPQARLTATNGVVIKIIAAGSTAEDAQRAANEAAGQVRRTSLTNFGIDVLVLQPATNARSSSFVHRLLKR